MRSLIVTAFLCALAPTAVGQELPLLFQDKFEKGADRWQPTDPKAWKIDKKEGIDAFHQFAQSKFTPPFRSPLNFAIIKNLAVADFILEAKALSTGKDGPHRDMCLFWGYQDSAHYYYVHIAKQADDRANQIFIVNGKERVKISTTSTKGTPWDDRWHDIKIVRKVGDGSIAVYWDDMKTPIMTATDTTFAWGQVGVGSFDDSGFWTNIRISGVKHAK